jgi:transcriptional regulator with XRE-family HTH domain
MARPFGQTVREMREAQALGLRTFAERLGISPAYLSRIERGKEHPPKPEIIKRMATLLGGDPDLLFRLSESTDPDLADFMNIVPEAAQFLRTAKTLGLRGEDFEVLTEEIRERSRDAGRARNAR